MLSNSVGLAASLEQAVGVPVGLGGDEMLVPLAFGRVIVFVEKLLKACENGKRGLIPRPLTPADSTVDAWRIWLTKKMRSELWTGISGECRRHLGVKNEERVNLALAELLLEISNVVYELGIAQKRFAELVVPVGELRPFCVETLQRAEIQSRQEKKEFRSNRGGN